MESEINNTNNYELALGFLQVFDVLLNVSQVSNDTIFKELQKQNIMYLKKILEQNEQILSILHSNNMYDIKEITMKLEKD